MLHQQQEQPEQLEPDQLEPDQLEPDQQERRVILAAVIQDPPVQMAILIHLEQVVQQITAILELLVRMLVHQQLELELQAQTLRLQLMEQNVQQVKQDQDRQMLTHLQQMASVIRNKFNPAFKEWYHKPRPVKVFDDAGLWKIQHYSHADYVRTVSSELGMLFVFLLVLAVIMGGIVFVIELFVKLASSI